MDNELVPKEREKEAEFQLLPEDKLKSELTNIRKFQNIVKALMVKDLDYGIIPGTQKPTLYKPGAEKLKGMHLLCDQFEITAKIEDWEKPFFHYEFKCHLIHIPTDKEVSQGVGSCNSNEGKFRYRWVYEKDIPSELTKEELKVKEFAGTGSSKYKKYRIGNDDLASQVNTILKMGKKRAFIDAVLSACRLSAVFTQDIEDLRDNGVIEGHVVEDEKKQSKPAPTVNKVTPKDNDKISDNQRRLMFSKLDDNDINQDVFRQWLNDRFKISSTKDIPERDFDEVLKWIGG